MHPAQLLVRQLADYYGTAAVSAEVSLWAQGVAEVLAGHLSARKFAHIWPEIRETWLLDVEQVAQSQPVEIQHLLMACGATAKPTKMLWGLARWWCEHDAGESPFAGDLTERLQSLRQVGCSLTWAARLLCRVGQRDIFPIDRATQRVVCRHGWLDPQTEYEEWQDWFVRGSPPGITPLAQISRWMEQLGEEFCGPQPACAQCPLQSLLPLHGPVPDRAE